MTNPPIKGKNKLPFPNHASTTHAVGETPTPLILEIENGTRGKSHKECQIESVPLCFFGVRAHLAPRLTLMLVMSRIGGTKGLVVVPTGLCRLFSCHYGSASTAFLMADSSVVVNVSPSWRKPARVPFPVSSNPPSGEGAGPRRTLRMLLISGESSLSCQDRLKPTVSFAP